MGFAADYTAPGRWSSAAVVRILDAGLCSQPNVLDDVESCLWMFSRLMCHAARCTRKPSANSWVCLNTAVRERRVYQLTGEPQAATDSA